MSQPRWFTGTDAKLHLVYELELINGFPVPVTVRSVAVRDTGAGAVLLSLTGKSLINAISGLAGPGSGAELKPASVGVVWVDLTLEAGAQPPNGIDHAVTVSVPPGLPVPATITSVGAGAEVDPQAPTVIGPAAVGLGLDRAAQLLRRAAPPLGAADRQRVLVGPAVRDRLQQGR